MCGLVHMHVCIKLFVLLCAMWSLAEVHSLVQMYTIPKTGQLSYVGHVCNLHHKVTECMSKLSTLPANMPFVKVRPRNSAGQLCRKAAFTVNVEKLRRVFEWLRKYNTYYRVVEWKEDWAQAWLQHDVDVGFRREEEFADGHEACLSKEGGVQDNELVKVFVQR